MCCQCCCVSFVVFSPNYDGNGSDGKKRVNQGSVRKLPVKDNKSLIFKKCGGIKLALESLDSRDSEYSACH